MKYILAFSLLFLAACGEEELDSAGQGEAKYEFLQGNWTSSFFIGNQNYEHRLRLSFGHPNKDELTVFYSCREVSRDGKAC